MALPRHKRNKFADHLQDAVHASAAQRQQKYGTLAAVNLASHIAIHEQVKNIPVLENMRFSAADAGIIKSPSLKTIKKTVVQPQQAALATQLNFIVDSLTCTKTNDLHKDEISLGASGSDSTGASFETAPFFVGKYKKGETLPLGAKANLFQFSADGGSVGGEFPITYIAGIFLTEADLIHDQELGDSLIVLFSVLSIVFISGMMGLVFIPGVGPTLAIISGIIGVVCGLLGHVILPLLIDDFSDFITDTFILQAQPQAGLEESRQLALEFFKGKYTANIRWVTQ